MSCSGLKLLKLFNNDIPLQAEICGRAGTPLELSPNALPLSHFIQDGYRSTVQDVNARLR